MRDPGEVLVIDGDASIRSLLEVVVRMVPKSPVAAADGRSAVALLASRSFDAIVLDLVLPEVSGEDVLHFVASHAPHLLAHTIVVTTLPASRWSSCAETRACAAVLSKPFALDELRTALRACCQESPKPDLHEVKT